MTESSLHAPHVLEYDYTRSLGPILNRFCTGLRDRRIIGTTTSDGRVVVPPVEFDPVTLETLGPESLVEVGSAGTVTTWAWVNEPKPNHPFDRPFAFALVQLDGADVPFLHAVDAGTPDAMSTGMRVQARWADETIGHINDIAAFVPATDDDRGGAA